MAETLYVGLGFTYNSGNVADTKDANSGTLKRSNSTHHLPAAKRQQSFRQRTAPRASQACHACAASKTKCDNHQTCRRCRKKNVPCIRNFQLPYQEDEIEVRVALDTATFKRQISPTGALELPIKHSDAVTTASQPHTLQNSFDVGDSTPCSTVPFNSCLDDDTISQGPNSFIQDMTNQSKGPALVPMAWNIDTSFDLFDLDNKLDWVLNAPEVDFLSSLELSQSDDTTVPSHDVHTALASPVPSSDGNEGSYTVQQAFRQSIGQWTPESRHYRAHGEKDMMSEDLTSLTMHVLGHWDPFIAIEPLVPRTRDKLVAMAATSCEPGNMNAVVSAFPAVDVLDRLINIALTQQKAQVDGYIHVPTFSKSESRIETLAALVVNGSVGSSNRAVQKFGYGLWEILSCYLHNRAEREYSLTRDLHYLQALSLSLHDALWSGIKNKMEMAGSLLGLFINMLRVGGRFRRTTYPPIIPTPADFGDSLDKKWRAWVVQESFKRMVFHIQIHCVQESFMTSTAALPLSSSELSLPPPESRELWLAPSAVHWKEAFLRLQPRSQHRAPSVLECIGDPGKGRLLPETCDREFTSLARLYTVASLVCSFKHMQSLFATSKDSSLNRLTLIADESQERRLTEVIQALNLWSNSCGSLETAVWSLLRELLSMHLHTSFNQLELFAGREGPEEAQPVYPTLCAWMQSQSSRQAVWHAGQILRHMRTIPVGSLHIFHALACYHAGLCLCVYGLLLNLNVSRSASAHHLCTETETVLLDGEETLATQRWTLSSVGKPMIARSPVEFDTSTQSNAVISLESTSTIMSVVIDVVNTKFQERSSTKPLLVDNIVRLMRSVGKMHQAGFI